MTDSGRREFLYVAHNFPPLIGGGVARTEQNCKLLPEYGWVPTLLTAAVDGSSSVDHKYSGMGVTILRASGIIKENRIRALPRGIGNKETPFSIRALRFLARWLLIPDRLLLWKFPAQWMALKAAKKHQWQCVFGTMPPMTAAWIGQCAAKRLGLPFVLEYRDMISEDYMRVGLGFLRKCAIRAIERRMVHSAAKIVAVSPGIKDWIVRRHSLDPKNVEMIPTGFLSESREFFKNLPEPRNEQFTMTYIGTFQRERKPDTVLNAVRILIDRQIISPQKLKVILISNLVASTVSHFGLDGVAETVSMIPHEEVFGWYAKSDLLLLICDKYGYQNVTYPGKLFEYLMTGKPILGLMDKNSVTAEVLRKSGIGLVVDADDVEEAAARIEFLYKKWEHGTLSLEPNNEIIQQFSCEKLVKRMASLLEQVSACGY